jgi:hypothetical protein
MPSGQPTDGPSGSRIAAYTLSTLALAVVGFAMALLAVVSASGENSDGSNIVRGLVISGLVIVGLGIAVGVATLGESRRGLWLAFALTPVVVLGPGALLLLAVLAQAR